MFSLAGLLLMPPLPPIFYAIAMNFHYAAIFFIRRHLLLPHTPSRLAPHFHFHASFHYFGCHYYAAITPPHMLTLTLLPLRHMPYIFFISRRCRFFATLLHIAASFHAAAAAADYAAHYRQLAAIATLFRQRFRLFRHAAIILSAAINFHADASLLFSALTFFAAAALPFTPSH